MKAPTVFSEPTSDGCADPAHQATTPQPSAAPVVLPGPVGPVDPALVHAITELGAAPEQVDAPVAAPAEESDLGSPARGIMIGLAIALPAWGLVIYALVRLL